VSSKTSRFGVTTGFTWDEEDALTQLQEEIGLTRAEVMRAAFFKYLAEHKPEIARKLMLARAAGRRVARIAPTLLFALFMPFASARPNFECRRPRVQTVFVRANRHPGRRNEWQQLGENMEAFYV